MQQEPWGDGLEQSLEVLEGMENYTSIVYRRFLPYIGERTLEIGCGIGSYTRHLVKKGSVLSIDIEPRFVEQVRKHFGHLPNFKAGVLGGEDLHAPLIADFKPDTIVCINVLEHIEHDVDFLRKFKEALVPGGKVILLVPAYQWLYGSLDKSFGHYRRYGLKELREKFSEAGFEFVYSSYLSPFSIPGWFLQGRVFKKTQLNPMHIKAYDKIIPWIGWSVRFLERWVGMSLLFVAKKP